MPTTLIQKLPTGHSGLLTFAVTVVAIYASALAGLSAPQAPDELLPILVGAAYLFIGTVCFVRCARGLNPAKVNLYFSIQIAMGALVVYLLLGRDFVLVILLPLAGQSEDLQLDLRRRVGVWIGLLGAALIPNLLVFGWDAALYSGLTFAAGLAFVVTFSRIAVRERLARAEVERLAAELRGANQQLRTYAAQAEGLAMMKERNRVAREIHDSLGHYLTSLNVQLGAICTLFDTDPERALSMLEKSKSLVVRGLTDVRRSVGALRDGPLDRCGLHESVARLVDDCRIAGLQVVCDISGSVRPLDPQLDLTLYRVVQESLTNVLKHAGATRVAVDLCYRPAAIDLTIEDDGIGLQDTWREESDGFGLLGLHERTRKRGVVIQVEVPHE